MDQSGSVQTSSPLVMIVYLVIMAVVIAGMWKMFTKAGEPGWAAIIPIYNTIEMLKIAGRPIWWILLMLVPVVNIVVMIVVMNDLSKAFGKGVGTTIGLIFLSFIFIPMLGFGSATYQRPAAAVAAAA